MRQLSPGQGGTAVLWPLSDQRVATSVAGKTTMMSFLQALRGITTCKRCGRRTRIADTVFRERWALIREHPDGIHLTQTRGRRHLSEAVCPRCQTRDERRGLRV